jgi:hypothetical protein
MGFGAEQKSQIRIGIASPCYQEDRRTNDGVRVNFLEFVLDPLPDAIPRETRRHNSLGLQAGAVLGGPRFGERVEPCDY